MGATVWFVARSTNSLEPAVVPTETTVSVLVVPHHDLLLDQFQDFYDAVPPAERSLVTQIILLAPNHFQPESTVIKTRDAPFVVSGLGEVEINLDFLPVLQETGVKINREVFTNEHAVFLQLPLIKKNFPDATITPLLFTRNISTPDLETVISVLRKTIDSRSTLVLVSTDFSHYLPFAQAEKNDEQTLKLIDAHDATAILRLNDDFVDCPACLYVLLGILPKDSGAPTVVFHGNSAQYLPLAAAEPTTSYFVLRW